MIASMMFKRAGVAASILLAASVSGESADPASWPEAEVFGLLDEYFRDGSDRAEVLKKLEPHQHIPADRIPPTVQHIRDLLRKGPKPVPDEKGKCTLQHPTEKGTYYLSGAVAGSKDPQPVLITLHGGAPGIEGDKQPGIGGAVAMAEWRTAKTPLAGAIVLSPNQPGDMKRAWTDQEGGARFVRACLEEVKRGYNVDTNRIYVVGFSLGGFGSWYIGSLMPDLFAAVSGGGCTPHGVIENLHVLPCWQYWGLKDSHGEYKGYYARKAKQLQECRTKYGGYEAHLQTYEKLGHGYPPEGHGPILECLSERTRDPYPKKVVWKPALPSCQRGCYWLWGAKGLVVAERNLKEKAKNVFVIEGDLEGVEILLNGAMVDFGQPVVVLSGGKQVFQGMVPQMLGVLLRSLEEWNDPEHLFTASIVLPKP